MRVIGRAYPGPNDTNYSEGYIAQLSRDELHQLGALVRVLSNKADNDFIMSHEVDLTQAPKAITAFAEIKHSVNELQDILKRLDESLMPHAHE